MGVLSHKHAYVSEAKVKFHEDSLERFIDQYSPMNQKLQITGFIIYRRGIFFHLLEGTCSQIETLMDQFRRDDRLKIIKELDLPPTKKRVFPYWNMKHIVDLEHFSIESKNRVQIKEYWDTMLPCKML